MTAIEIEKENAEIAIAYKKLLKVSCQTLTTADKKLICIPIINQQNS